MRKVLFALMLIFAATQIIQAEVVTIDGLEYSLYYPGSVNDYPKWATNTEESIAVLYKVPYGKQDVSIPYEITYNGRVFRVAGIDCNLYGTYTWTSYGGGVKYTENVTVTFADNADLYLDVSDKLGGHVKKLFSERMYIFMGLMRAPASFPITPFWEVSIISVRFIAMTKDQFHI